MKSMIIISVLILIFSGCIENVEKIQYIDSVKADKGIYSNITLTNEPATWIGDAESIVYIDANRNWYQNTRLKPQVEIVKGNKTIIINLTTMEVIK